MLAPHAAAVFDLNTKWGAQFRREA